MAQRLHRGGGEVADRVDAAAPQHLLGLAANAPELGDRQRMQERDGLVAWDHEEPVRLGQPRRDLRHELRRGGTHRHDESRLGVHALAQQLRDLHGRAEHGPGARDIQERLVDAEPLHPRREVVHDAHDDLRVVRVPLVVRLEDDRLRAALEGDRHGQRRVHAELAGLVGGGGHDRPGGWMPHDHRLADELGMIEQLDRGEERVEVGVEDGGGAVVDGPDGHLPFGAVLLAHAPILAVPTDPHAVGPRTGRRQAGVPSRALVRVRSWFDGLGSGRRSA
jgi:hypothetical protein